MLSKIRRLKPWSWVEPGYRIPRLHGLVLHDYPRGRSLFFVMPVNVALRAMHAAYCAVRAGLCPHWMEKRMFEARMAGIREARRATMEAIETVSKQIDKEIGDRREIELGAAYEDLLRRATRE